jgi:hypothetical protein
MPITIACQHCDWKGRVPDNLAGRKGKCPTCGELVPIPKKGTPPPVPAGHKAAVDDEPDLVDDADIVEDEPRPPAKRPAPAHRPADDDEDDDRPRKARRRDDEDDRPARSRRRADDDDEDERPRKARRRDDDEDEDDDRPRKARPRDDEDEDDDDDYQPRRSKRLADEDDDDRSRKKRPARRRPRKKSGGNSARNGAIFGGIAMILIAVAVLALLFFVFGRCWPYGFIMAILGAISLFRGLFGMESDGSDD